jgi:hypothetical protein
MHHLPPGVRLPHWMAKHTLRASIILLAIVATASLSQSIAQSSGGSSSVAGTLVVAAPSRDGLIVAADTRARIGDSVVCDSYHKISEPARPDRTVVAVVGAGIQVPPPPAEMTDPCAYIRQAPRHFDINALVKTFLETSGANVATMGIEELAASCVETIVAFQRTRGDDIRRFWGDLMFGVMLATYVPAERTSIVKWFSVRLSPTGEPFVSEKETSLLRPTSQRMVIRFGESEFFQKQVFNGPGRQFLGRGWKEWRTKARIADIDRSLALAAAVDMIEAAAKTAKMQRSDPLIGGSVDAVLLGDQPRPQRLRWTTP